MPVKRWSLHRFLKDINGVEDNKNPPWRFKANLRRLLTGNQHYLLITILHCKIINKYE
jgi:hypothetical protein